MTDRSQVALVGRRAAIVGFYCVVVAFIATAAYQVSTQVLAKTQGRPVGDCRTGIVQLARAVARARDAAHAAHGADAVEVFGRALRPAWGRRDQVVSRCRAENVPGWAESFQIVERLRYGEEAVLRRDQQDIERLREQAARVVGAFSPTPKDETSRDEDW